MSDPIESAITNEHSRQEHALAAALEQIDVAFGKEENLTPEQRRLSELCAVREGLARLAEADIGKDRDEQGWTTIDPVTAFVIAWYLRKEADSDHVLGTYGLEASSALEEVADSLEGGEILACPQEMLAQLDDAVEELCCQMANGCSRSAIAAAARQGENREAG